jgi:hypothetical protein
LQEVKEPELERLLVSVLPTEFAGGFGDDPADYELELTIHTCDSEAFRLAGETTRQKTAQQLVKVVKEGSEARIANYERLFCTGS